MKINKEKEQKSKKIKTHKIDKGTIFVKVMAGILALFMLAGTVASLVFALIER